MPRVAVVVPCFDDGSTLEEAVDSLAEQEPHELVVVDDGSTDAETLRVLDRIGERGVSVIRQANRGLSAARMAGVHETTAPYVMPLDADDALEPGALAALADALDADPEAAVAWGDIAVFGEIDAKLRTAPSLDPWRITYLNDVPGTSLVRRSALLDAGGWDMGSGFEDWDLWMALAERGYGGVNVRRPMLRYRRRGGRMLAETIERHAELYGRLRKRHPHLFASRGASWRRSDAPWRTKALVPLVHRLPISAFDRHRLTLFVNDPSQIRSMRRLRRQSQ
jgi:glycosyltransferase involved in cell wall biosynthesis